MDEIWNNIKCPFCFRRFAHDEVHFRLAESACEKARDEANQAKSEEEQERFMKFCRRQERDPKYDTVWGNLRGGTPTPLVGQEFYIPWVDSDNKREMIVGDYIKDKDGFVEKIEDRCGNFESRTRICPFCHNKLPLHYGKNPQKFFAILGVSASGKTVYIKQLLARLQDSLAEGILNHVDGSFVELTLPEDENDYITLDQPLPDSTRDLNFKIPYFITMTFRKDNKLTTYDFVIYDVAGETLVNADPNKFNFFAGYIKESDAILTLIDPMQLVSNPKPEYPAGEMISTLYQVFGDRVEIPTAIVISKSDLLLSSELIQNNLNPDMMYFNANSIITQDIPWTPAKRYFYSDVYAQLRGALSRFFRAKAGAFDTAVDQNIGKASYFAVSALFDGVDQRLKFELQSLDEWKSTDIDGLIQKFRILEKKLLDIKDDLEDQEANPDKNFIDANNIIVERSFVFDQSDEIVRKLDVILGNISTLNNRSEIRNAVYEQFDEDEVIPLSAVDRRGDETLTIRELIKYISYLNEEMDLCKFDIYLQGYPRNNGDLKSLRIEEPFFWLLSQLDMIGRGNLYDTQGTGGGGEKKRRWFPFK